MFLSVSGSEQRQEENHCAREATSVHDFNNKLENEIASLEDKKINMIIENMMESNFNKKKKENKNSSNQYDLGVILCCAPQTIQMDAEITARVCVVFIY